MLQIACPTTAEKTAINRQLMYAPATVRNYLGRSPCAPLASVSAAPAEGLIRRVRRDRGVAASRARASPQAASGRPAWFSVGSWRWLGIGMNQRARLAEPRARPSADQSADDGSPPDPSMPTRRTGQIECQALISCEQRPNPGRALRVLDAPTASEPRSLSLARGNGYTGRVMESSEATISSRRSIWREDRYPTTGRRRFSAMNWHVGAERGPKR
jgi:hypothetical protein